MRSKLHAAITAGLFAACLFAAGPTTARAQTPAATPAPAPAQTPTQMPTLAATPTPTPPARDGATTAASDESGRGMRVPLAQVSTAFDAAGRAALSATLSTQALAGTPDAPVRNVRVVVANAGPSFYNYVAGYATFYDANGVRCGAGLFTFGAAAVGERVEVDTPGLRLTCTPTDWRVVATALLTAAGDAAQPLTAAPSAASAALPTAASAATGASPAVVSATAPGLPPLEINVNGKTIPVQLNNPLELVVGAERVRIVVQPAP